MHSIYKPICKDASNFLTFTQRKEASKAGLVIR